LGGKKLEDSSFFFIFLLQQSQELSYSLHQPISTMGLFNRSKNKSSQSGERSPSLNSETIHSPRSAKPPATPSFGSLPTIATPKPPDPNVDPAAYLKSIYAVRERTSLVANKARRNQLNHFDVDMTKWTETAQYVVSIIKVCFPLTWYQTYLT
jgi:hypothetical protein